VISVQQGRDPQDYTLLAFGGAGGLHAVELARELGMPRVLVPRQAATLSALGMLMADAAKDYSRTVMLRGDTAFADLQAAMAPLIEQGRADLTAEGYPAGAIRLEASADLRYAGQSFELNIAFSVTLLADFHAAHLAAYGYQDAEAEVEIVNLRVKAIGLVEAPPLPKFSKTSAKVEDALIGRYLVRYAEGAVETPFYDAERLGTGAAFPGPAIVVHPDTTILVGAQDQAKVDEYLNLQIMVGAV